MPCRPSPARCSSCTRTRSWCSTAEGAGILVHLGIDTDHLAGEGFELLVAEKDAVEAGQPVTRWSPADVAERGLSPMVMVCVLDTTARRRDQRPHRRHRRGGRRTLRLARRLVTSPPVAALLLDLDGTLVDSEPLHRERYRAWFERRGWPYDDEVAPSSPAAAPTTSSAPSTGRGAARTPTRCSPRSSRWSRSGSFPSRSPARWRRSRGRARPASRWRWSPRRRRDGPAGRSSRFGGIDAFDTTVTRDDIANGKPDPACYALACERLGVDPGAARRLRGRARRRALGRRGGRRHGRRRHHQLHRAAAVGCRCHPHRARPHDAAGPARPLTQNGTPHSSTTLA